MGKSTTLKTIKETQGALIKYEMQKTNYRTKQLTFEQSENKNDTFSLVVLVFFFLVAFTSKVILVYSIFLYPGHLRKANGMVFNYIIYFIIIMIIMIFIKKSTKQHDSTSNICENKTSRQHRISPKLNYTRNVERTIFLS